MPEERDELGLTAADWAEIAAEDDRWRREHRWKALRALWGRPIKSPPRDRRKGWTIYDGYERRRDEDWSLVRAFVATIAIVFDRQETGEGYRSSASLAWWDAHDTYGGYEIMRLQLFPGCRVSIFSDGECLM